MLSATDLRAELARMLFKAMPGAVTIKWTGKNGEPTERRFKTLPITMRRHLGQLIYENSEPLGGIVNKIVKRVQRQEALRRERDSSGMTRRERVAHAKAMRDVYLELPDIDGFEVGAEVTVLDQATQEETKHRATTNPVFKTLSWAVLA